MKETAPDKLSIFAVMSAILTLTILFAPTAFAQRRRSDVPLIVPPQCRYQQLSVRHDSEDAAMGGVRSMHFFFTNVSSSSCTLKGYPRFELLNRAGRVAPSGRAGNGITRMGDDFKEPPRLVTIEPGKMAAFWIHYRARGAGSLRRTPCPTYRRFRITPPGVKRFFIESDEIEVCGELEVSPVRTDSE